MNVRSSPRLIGCHAHVIVGMFLCHWQLAASALLCILLSGCNGKTVSETQITDGPTITVKHAAVVSVSAPASSVGRDILKKGGNAVDAAIATAFALAVTFPEAGNIGGGGFMLIHPGPGNPQLNKPIVIDYREMAPAAATTETFTPKDRTPHKMAGVPGTVRGLALAHQRFGKLPWKDLVLPAVALARDGFELNEDVAKSLNEVLTKPGDEAAEMRRVLAKRDKSLWKSGDRLIQPDLAATLETIATAGPDSFYKGPIADAIIATLDTGFMTTADLAAYEAKIRQPIHGTFRGHDIFAPPPPSSGGIAVIQMLNMLEHLDLRQHDRFSPQALHLMIETMRRAYVDRARHLGDPDFVSIPSHLTTKEYAATLASQIDPNKATPSDSLAADMNLAPEGTQTTHFSVIDKDGMAVSNTYTLEERYGGRVMVKGAGFLLNNEMGDFNHSPGLTNRAGRIGTPANLVAPRKRMLSSMTPVIVAKNGKVIMLTGSPGGRTIINTVLCVLVNRLEYNLPPRDCVDAPRLNMTWLPDKVTAEAALHKDHSASLDALKKLAHTIDPKPARQGDAHTIVVQDDGTILGLADKRRGGSASGY